MEEWRVGLALGVPWLAGTLWVRALWRTAPAGGWLLALGYGYFLGLLATVLLLRAQAALGQSLDWAGPTLFLGLTGVVAGGWRWRRSGLSFPSLDQEGGRGASGWFATALFILLLLALGWRWLLLAQEVWLRPTWPWDAWTTWDVRARVWSELQTLVPFVDAGRWLAEPDRPAYALEAWHYPETVSLLALWPTLAFGAWNESIAHLPWLGLAAALGFGFYGQARCWGASPLPALIFVWLLLSLPMLNTHIALAGYADVWLAAVFGLAVSALLQWARTGDRWQGLLALLLALAAPWIKREGLVWALLLFPAALAVWTPRRYWLWLGGGGALALLVWWMAGGVAVSLPGWGEVRVTPAVIQLPALGRFELHYHDVWGPVTRNLFLLGNWHLFGYLLLAALLWGLPRAAAEPWRLAGMMVTVSGLLALFVLFFFTDAHHWARQYTSINRVLLQLVPALLFWMLTVFQPPRRSDP